MKITDVIRRPLITEKTTLLREENRTVVCVAHRIATLKTMDRIIVLKDGRIVEDGTFAGLLAQNGIFNDLARRQGIYSAEVSGK